MVWRASQGENPMRRNPLDAHVHKTVHTALAAIFIVAIGAGWTATAWAGDNSPDVGAGLVMPKLDPVKGKALYISKGCVVCHAINGVGGTDAPPIDASTMALKMSPFDFVAKMWNHSQGMVAMQQQELGGQITFENGQQIADIIAFLHDAKVQKTFSKADLPANIKAHLDGDGGSSSSMMNGKVGGHMGQRSMMGGSGRGGMMNGN
jgi:mono/diheme cytochrome c family protein